MTRYRVEPSYTVREHLVRAGALAVGYLLAAGIVLGAVMVACSAIGPHHVDAPAYVTPAPSGDTWGLPIEEPTRTTAPRPSWLVTLPSGAPAGLDIEDLCAQLQAPGEVPECADIGY